MKMFGSWSRLVSVLFRKDGMDVTLQPNQSTTYTAPSAIQLPPVDGPCVLISAGEVSSTYLTQSNAASTYLSQSDASSTYLTQSNAASTYLSQSDAASTYLSQSDAASTYLTQSNAASSYQPLDADLTALADLGSTGFIVRTGAGTVEARSITATAQGGLDVFIDDGVVGNPELSIQFENIVPVADPIVGADKFIMYSDSEAALRSGLVQNLPFQDESALLTDIAGLSGDGMIVKSGGGAVVRNLAASAPITIDNADGVLGDPTVGIQIFDAVALGAAPASDDEILIGDVSDAYAVKKITVSELAAAIGPSAFGYAVDWDNLDGQSKLVQHNLGSVDVMVQVYDKADGSTIYVDSVLRQSSDQVYLTASEIPGNSGWRVLVQKIA